ncbi:MAG TPA: hypothetical protein VGH28_07250 [Polyangiaceae bacterium]
MSKHVYVEPKEIKGGPGLGSVGFLFALVAGGIGGGLAMVVEPSLRAPIVLAILVFVLGTRFALVYRPKLVRELQALQLGRLREHLPETIAKCRALLRRGVAPLVRAHVLTVLAECAEMEGDFTDAADLLVRAEGIVRATRMNAVLRAQQLAVIAARRAFAHAACGELDRAEITLRTAGVSDGVPLAGALASRALLLVLARRGLKQQVLERLASDARLMRNTLAWRDRALVAVIAANATGRAVPPGSIDPAIAPWVARAFPEAAVS